MPKSKAITSKLEPPKPTPVAPVPASKPAVPAGTVVDTCGTCAQSGLDCVCERNVCRCCAPGDYNCNAYDL
jgi:hypothetical protein